MIEPPSKSGFAVEHIALTPCGLLHPSAIFIKKNEEFGNFSPDYPVTLSYQ